MMILDKKKLLKILMLMIVLLLPFSVNSTDSDLASKYLTDSTVGFYQTNTCEFSFANFAINNLGNQKIIIKKLCKLEADTLDFYDYKKTIEKYTKEDGFENN